MRPPPAHSDFSSPLFIEKEREKKKSQPKPVAHVPFEARSASQTNKYIEQSSGRTGHAAAGAEAAAANSALGSPLSLHETGGHQGLRKGLGQVKGPGRKCSSCP